MPVIEGARYRGSTTDNATGYGPFISAGVPAGGYLNGTAEKGAEVIDTTNGKHYTNTGTKAATVWTVTGTQV